MAPVFYTIFLLGVGLLATVNGAACPCKDSKLCSPITGQRKWEVFAFSTSQSNWPNYDWDTMTTIATTWDITNTNLVCQAHSKNVRVVRLVDIGKTAVVDTSARKSYVKKWIQMVKDDYMDGLNVDFEESVQKSETAVIEGINMLMQELRQELDMISKDLQLTFDTPWAPNCAFGRCYDYSTMSKYVDFFFIMDYDMTDDSKPAGQACSQSPLPMNLKGVKMFLSLGMTAKKLVMGLPWYGYDFSCVSISHDNKCKMTKRVQVNYANIMSSLIPYNTSGLLWDNESKSVYFNYKNHDSGALHQVWFDNYFTLKDKVKAAYGNGLRGTGMWQADCLDYKNKTQTTMMWKAMLP